MGEETNATEPIKNFAETLHDFENFSRWCWGMLYEAHEREVDALRGDTYLDAVSDSVLAKHGLVRLPVDADGEPIHAGDVLDGYGKTIEVVELRYGRSGWVLISRDGNGYADTFAFAHHHAPTVEDVLREFAEKITDSQIPGMHPTYEEAIAEYAAKLHLADDKEE